MNKNEMQIAEERLSNRLWRLENLYHIVDKSGSKVPFKLNWAQRELFDNQWHLNIILKSRQLGISTFIVLQFLDACLFNSNMNAAVIADTRENAEHLFVKARQAYDWLPPQLKTLRTVETDRVNELVFNNGSVFRVGTSLRSSTQQLLHVSEYGRICAKQPEKATEILEGAFNTIQDGFIYVESTAEGASGHFYNLCKRAQELKNSKLKLSPADPKGFFFPWWRQSEYRLSEWQQFDPPLIEYFQKLKLQGIQLLPEQQMWYAAKRALLGDAILKEYPSLPQEAFLASSEGLYYAAQLNQARVENRIGNVPHNPSLPCFTSWDLGIADNMVIWIYQLCGREIHFIDFIEDSGKPLPHYINLLKNLPYNYKMHFVPHDAEARELSTGLTRTEVARNLGFQFTVAKNIPVMDGIDCVRSMFGRCWFDERKCAQGLKALSNYKKSWNDRLGSWSEKPLHDTASHASDAFRIAAVCLPQTEYRGLTEIDIHRMRQESMGIQTNLPSFFQPMQDPSSPWGYGY